MDGWIGLTPLDDPEYRVSEPFLGGVGYRSPATGMSPPFCTRRYWSWSDESDRHGDDDLRVFLRMRYLSIDEPSTLLGGSTYSVHRHQQHDHSCLSINTQLAASIQTAVETCMHIQVKNTKQLTKNTVNSLLWRNRSHNRLAQKSLYCKSWDHVKCRQNKNKVNQKTISHNKFNM